MERRRVVVTGMGILSPVGNTIDEAWQSISTGKSGVGPITRFDAAELDVKVAGEVKGFDAKALFGHKETRRMDRVTQLAMGAAKQAIEDSRLDMATENPYRVGCVVSTCIGGIESLLDQAQQSYEKGIKLVSPLLLPMILTDSLAGRIAIEYNLRGPNMCISTACATGNNALGEAAEMIRRGSADVMVAGGSEAAVLPLAVSSLNNMTTLSRNADPATASRPFDKDRDGFVLAEGAGVLVLEALDHALARGAVIYAELLGYGTTDDAYHITAPRSDGEGAAMAMQIALQNAGITPAQVDYINAHGTSTALNDASETQAIKRVWQEQAYNVPISSTKSMTGHMIGAAGAVEAIFSIQAINCGFVPPTINLNTPDPACDLNYTANQGVSRDIKVVMSNAFGFGGHNAVLVIGKYRG
jgi:3-oxoacyl-[acyl-carrier-protein] synthase II